MTRLSITPAQPEDLDALIRFTALLAESESIFEGLDLDRERFYTAFFGPRPRIFALLARVGEQVVGVANYFFTFSSFQALPCIWLEDLYILESHRRLGVGQALLTELQSVGRQEGCKHIEWLVTADNTPAVDFYRRQGADIKEGLRYVQLSLK